MELLHMVQEHVVPVERSAAEIAFEFSATKVHGEVMLFQRLLVERLRTRRAFNSRAFRLPH